MTFAALKVTANARASQHGHTLGWIVYGGRSTGVALGHCRHCGAVAHLDATADADGERPWLYGRAVDSPCRPKGTR